MINAYKNFFKGYVDFTGRSTRSEFWWVWLTNILLLIPLYSAYFNVIFSEGSEGAFLALFYHLSSISRALSKKRDKTVAILRLLSYFYHLLIHKRAR